MSVSLPFTKEQAQEVLKIYQKDPIGYFTKVLDVDPANVWDKMAEVILSVRDNKGTVVKAGHSVSKTYTAARIALWFLECFPPATVITTAPTHSQVEAVLWKEIHNAYGSAKIPLGGNLTKTKLDIGETLPNRPKWFAYGFSTKPDTITKQATAFQGFHNKHILIIFDEAAGIVKEIWEAAESLMASGYIVRFLAIGNPTSSRGEFPACFKSRRYNHITISVKDTPNYKEGREVIPGLSGREYEETVRLKYGLESNHYKARILGEIPDEDVESIISVADYDNAHCLTKYTGAKEVGYFGCDPADGGDETVCYYIKGTDIKDKLIMTRNNNTMVTAGRIWSWANGVCKEVELHFGIDANGVGKGVADRLEEFGGKVHKLFSQAKNINEGAPKETKKIPIPKEYYNLKAQIWIEGAIRFHLGECELKFKDDLLKEQLTKVRQFVMNGKIIIESRDDCIENYGWSADRATAWLFGVFIKELAEAGNKQAAKIKGSVIDKYRTKAKGSYMSA